MSPFCDFVVFADESGSPVLENPDPTFPMFALSLARTRHVAQVAPNLHQLKFDFVGHDQLILHKRDNRRQQKDFALQADAAARTAFPERVNDIVAAAEVEVIAALIDKVRLAKRYSNSCSPYEVALHFCMEKLLALLVQHGRAGRLALAA